MFKICLLQIHIFMLSKIWQDQFKIRVGLLSMDLLLCPVQFQFLWRTVPSLLKSTILSASLSKNADPLLDSAAASVTVVAHWLVHSVRASAGALGLVREMSRSSDCTLAKKLVRDFDTSISPHVLNAQALDSTIRSVDSHATLIAPETCKPTTIYV
ncbi:hypothetical protein PanWU01x14_307240 [Parasponia andersonii]|uniref:Uncharacterized protein n=1 Tax=Parasponia andersonii TaxID=3476 RepID=A0A2P5ARJ2_PARAD|nr:hypothetical protein PanWU01x14_307240 [Parasponia andersonii]